MAGKALKKKILQDVADNGGVDWLYDQIASGVTVADLARHVRLHPQLHQPRLE